MSYVNLKFMVTLDESTDFKAITAILTDLSSWYRTKMYEPFAIMNIESGRVLVVCFPIRCFVSIYQMRFSRMQMELSA